MVEPVIVGVDISTHRIDLAWLENGKPCRWHQELGKGSTIDRLRRIDVSWPCLPPEPETGHGWDVTDVCIEEPWGRGKALPPLHQVLGIVTRQAPPWARVAHVPSGDLRRAIGAKNTKADAHARIRGICAYVIAIDGEGHTSFLDGWDEHELDALVACIAWTRILEQQDAA